MRESKQLGGSSDPARLRAPCTKSLFLRGMIMMPGAEIVPGCHGGATAYGIVLQGYVRAVLGQADPQSPQADETIHWMPQHGCPTIVLILCGCGLVMWTQALKTG